MRIVGSRRGCGRGRCGDAAPCSESSSSAQNQKLRRSTSLGVSSTSRHVGRYPSWYLKQWSSRSMIPATQPMPPSERQILMSGKRTGIFEYSQSTALYMPYAKNSTATDLGRRVGRRSSATCPTSRRAGTARSRSPRTPRTAGPSSRSGCVGRPELVGRLRERDRTEATRRVAADLVGRDLRDRAGTAIWFGMNRPGAAPHHASRCQSLYARIADQREVVVGRPHREALTDEAGQERREAQRRRDAVDVHVGDARVDVPRAAAHLVEAGRLEAVLASTAGPTTALNPTFGSTWPFQTHASPPSSVGDDARLVVGELLREAAGERVGRLDDVVVDRDHRVRRARAARAPAAR